MEVTGLLSVLRRWLPIIMIVVALSGAATYYAAVRLPATYESRVRLLVGPINADSGTLKASELLTRTYGDLAKSEFVLRETITNLGLPVTPEALSSAVRSTVDTATRLMIVRVQDPDPDRSAAIANEIANQLAILASEGTVRPEGEITVVDSAVAGEPVGQDPILLMLVGAFGGALVAVTGALFIEYSRNPVAEKDELAEIVGAPYLGAVPKRELRLGRPAGVAVTSQPSSRRADAYRLLATKLTLADIGAPQRSVAVLATRRATASPALAVNLASALQQPGLRVALVDADDTATATALLGYRGRRGVGDLLAHVASGQLREQYVLRLCLRHHSGLTVLPAGGAAEPLSVAMVQQLMGVLLTCHNVVVVSVPSLSRSGASLAWTRVASATIVVARQGRTGREELREAVTSLRLVGSTIAGAVFEQRIAGDGRRRPPLVLGLGAVDSRAATPDRTPGSPPVAGRQVP